MEIAFGFLLAVWLITVCILVYVIKLCYRERQKYYDLMEERIYERAKIKHEQDIAQDMSEMLDEMSIALIEGNGLTKEQREFLAERYDYAKWSESINWVTEDGAPE